MSGELAEGGEPIGSIMAGSCLVDLRNTSPARHWSGIQWFGCNRHRRDFCCICRIEERRQERENLYDINLYYIDSRSCRRRMVSMVSDHSIYETRLVICFKASSIQMV